MEKIVVNGANIFIDLIDIGLIDEFFLLHRKVHTTDYCMLELQREGKNDPYAGKLKSIAVYGPDCKKLFEIHVDHTHNGMPIHYHPWENGHPIKVGTGKNSPNAAYALTPDMKNILEIIKKKVPYAK